MCLIKQSVFMKRNILLFTDLRNFQEGEDIFVSEKISDLCTLRMVNIDNISDYLEGGDGVLILNNWPAFGADVTELIQGYAIGKKLETTEQELMHTVFPHSALSEMMHESVLDAYDRVIHY